MNKQTAFEPVYVENIPKELSDGKIYISKEFGVAIHNCACGCGEPTVTPFTGHESWLLTDVDGLITLSPSIGNFQFKCKSHYFIQHGQVVWC